MQGVTVDFNANLARFTGAIDKATNDLNKFQSNTSRMASNVNSMFMGLGAGLSIGGFAAFIKSSIDSADSLNDLSKITGASVETLAGLQLAAKQSGVELETVAKGMLKFSGVVLDASNGSKEAADKISALGLNLKTLAAQSPEQQFIALAGALEKFGADKQGVIVADLLGVKMASLTPLLAEGAAGLSKMVDEGKRLNPITTEMAQQADAFNDELAKMSVRSSAAGLALTKDLLPSLAETAVAMNKLATEGHPLLALWRGLAGLGKLPFDFAFGSTDFSVKGQVADLREELEKLQDVQAGKRGRLSLDGLIPNGEEGRQRIAVIKNQIDALEKYAEKLEKKAAPPIKKADADYKIGKPGASKKTKDDLPVDVFGSGSFIASKENAEFIRKQYEAANDLDREFYKDKEKNAADYQSRLESLISDTPIVKTEKLLANIALLDEAFMATGDERYLQGVESITGKMEDIKASGTDTFADLTRAVEGWGNAFTDTLADMAMTGKLEFGQMADSIIRDLLRMSIQTSITKPLFDSFKSGDFMSSVSSFFTPSANGNVFSSPGLSAYSGSVVSKPTVFPFASGIGLMGEAGAEGIFPLKRGSNGKLGISAEGGGSNVVVNIIESPGKGGQQEQRNEGGTNILTVFVEQIKSAIASDITRGSGAVPAALGNTYGLNRAAGSY